MFKTTDLQCFVFFSSGQIFSAERENMNINSHKDQRFKTFVLDHPVEDK